MCPFHLDEVSQKPQDSNDISGEEQVWAIYGGRGMVLGGIIFYCKPQDVNLTNMMNKFSMAVLNNHLSSSHSSQQPLEPAALQAGLCANAPVTKLSVFCPFREGWCHPCVTGRKTGSREDEKLIQSHRPSELEKYNPRVQLKSPGPELWCWL